jgi:hypothetical protein
LNSACNLSQFKILENQHAHWHACLERIKVAFHWKKNMLIHSNDKLPILNSILL